MRRRLIAGLCTIVIASVTLAGCGSSLPKLTEEENEMVSEYAASLLLKYDSENHSRLVNTSDFFMTYNQAVEAREESIRQYEEELAAKQDTSTSIESEIVIPENNTDVSVPEIVGDPLVAETKDLATFLNSDGFTVSYTGYKLTKRYPENSKAGATADKGKTLLIVTYDITAENDGTFDVLNQHASFSASVNGGAFFDNNISILPDEMSQFQERMNQGETKNIYLIFEIPENTTVNSLAVKVESIFSGEATYVLE